MRVFIVGRAAEEHVDAILDNVEKVFENKDRAKEYVLKEIDQWFDDDEKYEVTFDEDDETYTCVDVLECSNMHKSTWYIIVDMFVE